MTPKSSEPVDVLALPSVPSVTGLEEAWAIMKAAYRSAIVIQGRRHPKVITARDVVVGLERGKTKLDQLKGESIGVLPQPISDPRFLGHETPLRGKVIEVEPVVADALHHQVVERAGLGAPHRRFDQRLTRTISWVGSLLDSSSLEQGLIGLIAGGAVLLTRADLWTSVSGSPPKNCWCTDPDYPHPYDHDNHGETCDLDDSKIVCKR